jgi:hypothetical protein
MWKYVKMKQLVLIKSSLKEFKNGTLILAGSYTDFCMRTSHCDASKGLYCPKTKDLCNCPIKSSSIFCDCKIGFYWDFTDEKCGTLFNPLFFFLIFFF